MKRKYHDVYVSHVETALESAKAEIKAMVEEEEKSEQPTLREWLYQSAFRTLSAFGDIKVKPSQYRPDNLNTLIQHYCDMCMKQPNERSASCLDAQFANVSWVRKVVKRPDGTYSWADDVVTIDEIEVIDDTKDNSDVTACFLCKLAGNDALIRLAETALQHEVRAGRFPSCNAEMYFFIFEADGETWLSGNSEMFLRFRPFLFPAGLNPSGTDETPDEWHARMCARMHQLVDLFTVHLKSSGD